MLWITCVAAALVPALAYANFVLNHFYLQGAYFLDTGAFAGLLWRRDLWLTNAPAFTLADSSSLGSEYGYHVMPLFSLLTVLSRFLPLSLPEWYATILGVGHALPAVGVFWLLSSGIGLRSPPGVATSAALAILFAFSGIPLATIAYPHFEILIAGGLILFMAALSLQRLRLAAWVLTATVLVREDVGFHAFGLLFVLIAVNAYRRRPWSEQRPLVLLAAGALVYSVCAVALKQLAFPDAPPLFVAEYLGSPPLATISPALVASRLEILLLYRPYVVWPAYAALAWAVWKRNPLIPLGYVAFLPWLALHLLANRDVLGALSGYYAFPFLVACAWPLAAVVIEAHQHGVTPDRRVALGGFAVLVAFSFAGLQHLWNPGVPHFFETLRGNFTTPADQARIRATDAAVARLVAATHDPASGPFGRLVTDQSVYSFAPYDLVLAKPAEPQDAASGARSQPIDTVAYFAAGIDLGLAQGIAAHAHLDHIYCFADTTLCLASARKLDGVPGLAPQPYGP
jgi:hypothetical protein